MFFKIKIQRIRLPSSCRTLVPSCRSLTETSARPLAAKADLWRAIWPLAARMDDVGHQYHHGGQMRGTTCLYWQADSELTCCPCPRSGWTWRRPLPFYKSMGCVCRSLAASCGSSIQDKESCFGRCTADVAMQLVHLWSRPLATTKLQDRLWTQCARHGLDYPLGM